MPGLFITGTNTGVGKTHVAAMIARSLVAAGHKVGVYKPVASGCGRVNGSLVAEEIYGLVTPVVICDSDDVAFIRSGDLIHIEASVLRVG